jgi:hypothetical protein
VSTLIILSGAATPSSTVNFCIVFHPGRGRERAAPHPCIANAGRAKAPGTVLI